MFLSSVTRDIPHILHPSTGDTFVLNSHTAVEQYRFTDPQTDRYTFNGREHQAKPWLYPGFAPLGVPIGTYVCLVVLLLPTHPLFLDKSSVTVVEVQGASQAIYYR